MYIMEMLHYITKVTIKLHKGDHHYITKATIKLHKGSMLEIKLRG